MLWLEQEFAFAGLDLSEPSLMAEYLRSLRPERYRIVEGYSWNEDFDTANAAMRRAFEKTATTV